MNSRGSPTKRKVEVSREAVPGTATTGAPAPSLRTSLTPRDVSDGTDLRAAASCCARFQFSEGFLLDTVTGELWRFNQTAGTLVAVPRVSTTNAGQADHQLIDENMQKAANALAQAYASILNLGR